MEDQNNNKAPEANSVEPKTQEAPTHQDSQSSENEGGKGPVIGTTVIIILLIFGGLYYWGTTLNNQAQIDESAIFDATTNNDITSPSDEPAQIESDLNTFDTTSFDTNLDTDLKAIENAL